MRLWKMHGVGNDFLVMDNRKLLLKDKSDFAARICDRHFGIGADGFIALEDSEDCDIKMSFYNADGTEDTMCGNGIRCLSKFARDLGVLDRREFSVETGDGTKLIKMTAEGKSVSNVMVDMGGYSFNVEDVGIDCPEKEFIDRPILMSDGRKFSMSCIRLGVSHGVIFVEDDLDYPLLYGREIENLPVFLKDMNVNFVKYIDEENIRVRTWERGVGKTLGCGTGSSSAAVITSRLKKTGSKINVEVPGGRLIIRIDNGKVLMEGPAVKICEIILEDYFTE